MRWFTYILACSCTLGACSSSETSLTVDVVDAITDERPLDVRPDLKTVETDARYPLYVQMAPGHYSTGTTIDVSVSFIVKNINASFTATAVGDSGVDGIQLYKASSTRARIDFIKAGHYKLFIDAGPNFETAERLLTVVDLYAASSTFRLKPSGSI